MNSNIEHIQDYWDKRYQAEGKVWGEAPSRTAQYALKLFRQAGVKRVLVPGSGYGRNTKLFSSSGFYVTGIEVSRVAFDLARKFDPRSEFFNTSALDMSFFDNEYDAIYCFNVLHLFREKDRLRLISQCKKHLNKKGMMFFTVFSEKEPSYGEGAEIEKDTFESRPGRPAHYFSEEDLKAHFAKFTLIETGLMEDPEEHGGKPHVHVLRYICVRTR